MNKREEKTITNGSIMGELEQLVWSDDGASLGTREIDIEINIKCTYVCVCVCVHVCVCMCVCVHVCVLAIV